MKNNDYYFKRVEFRKKKIKEQIALRDTIAKCTLIVGLPMDRNKCL